jgi:hypothetical protein
VKPDFVVTPEMRDELYQRFVKAGVTVDRKLYDSGATYITRVLDNRISGYAFGDSTAKRRQVSDDRQLMKAIEILKKSTSTKELLTIAATMPGAASKPKQ